MTWSVNDSSFSLRTESVGKMCRTGAKRDVAPELRTAESSTSLKVLEGVAARQWQWQ